MWYTQIIVEEQTNQGGHTMNSKILTQIEDCTVTEQQETGFKTYTKAVEEGFRTPSNEDFQTFYSFWCAENDLFNDINDSNFPPAERPDWA